MGTVRLARTAQRRVAVQPRWDDETRELWYGNILVKRFSRPAPIAARILRTFQQGGWPRKIDDPLLPLPTNRESKRLRNEVAALNRRLDNKVIRFFMDGTGQAICWEPVG